MSELFNVYPLFDIEPVRAAGAYLYDKKGTEYLDLYGGHAVISIGHSHPKYVKRVQEQVAKIGFYSNSVKNILQIELAQKLQKASGYTDYSLFLCNSGAEANENAIKLASFHNGGDKIIAFRHGFHGRTAGAVAATDNPKILAPVNPNHQVIFCDFENKQQVEDAIAQGGVCAIIIECIQGVGGLYTPSDNFLQFLETVCNANDICLIADEVQSGFGRTGNFFAHQKAGIQPHIISMAKGMGNGFPIGGVMIHPSIEPSFGMLGTTFGGNHLACAAALSVVETIEEEELTSHAKEMGEYLHKKLSEIPEVKQIRGRGLMIGPVFPFAVKVLRKNLLFENHIFTGSAADPNILRILPPLTIKKEELDRFMEALKFQSTQISTAV